MENKDQNLKCDQCQSPISDSKNAVYRNGKTFCSEACANQAEQRSGT